MEAIDLVIKAFANPSTEHTQVYAIFVVVTILVAIVFFFLWNLIFGDSNVKVTLDDFDSDGTKKTKTPGDLNEIRD